MIDQSFCCSEVEKHTEEHFDSQIVFWVTIDFYFEKSTNVDFKFLLHSSSSRFLGGKKQPLQLVLSDIDTENLFYGYNNAMTANI